jgi:aromatic ring-opening dioxygenase LigB subunit
MPLVSAAILPHGGAAIPGFKEGKADFSEVRRGMKEAVGMVMSREPQTVVIASPHNMRVENNMAIVTAENYAGKLEEGSRKVTVARKCDVGLAKSIYAIATKRRMPVVAVNFGTSSGPESKMPLDWGTMVPLWFFPRRVKVVVVTPSREIPWKDLMKMGECIGQASRLTPTRVSFIASADQAHAHSKSGPYGYDEAADEYDSRIVKLVKRDRLGSLMRFEPALIERAKPDGFWQMLILMGALKGKGLEPSCYSYSCPTYYGMLSAAYV